MMMQHQTFIVRLAIFWASALVAEVDSFVVPLPSSRVPALSASSTAVSGFMDSINEFFEELDAFIDDATSRRLGAGAAFYGKRKSNFYGSNDSQKKADKNIADPLEDYQGPTSSGMFEWMPDENGQLRPVTRGRKVNLERNPNYWDRFYASQRKKEQERDK